MILNIGGWGKSKNKKIKTIVSLLARELDKMILTKN
jgi:hypothetical protein